MHLTCKLEVKSCELLSFKPGIMMCESNLPLKMRGIGDRAKGEKRGSMDERTSTMRLKRRKCAHAGGPPSLSDLKQRHKSQRFSHRYTEIQQYGKPTGKETALTKLFNIKRLTCNLTNKRPRYFLTRLYTSSCGPLVLSTFKTPYQIYCDTGP